MENELIRINKYLAQAGICSRREADVLVESGRVVINGALATSGQKVSDSDDIWVDGKKIAKLQNYVYLAFNKPRGVVVSHKDEHAKVLIEDIIDYPERVTYAGRLDKDSEGLIILTNDGQFIQDAMKGSGGHEKEYVVVLDHEPDDTDISLLEKGIFLKDLNRKTRKCTIKKSGSRSVTMTITEGLNRQIRRMWAERGYEVVKLRRIRVMNVELGDLRPGEYREINGKELESLLTTLSLNR